MMSLVVHRQITSLSSFIRTLGTLKGRRFAPTLDHLVPPHRAFPPITLTTEPATKFTLLFMRYTHVDNTEIRTRLGQHFERVRKYNLSRRPIAIIVIVSAATTAVTSCVQATTLPRSRRVVTGALFASTACMRPTSLLA